MKEFFLHSQTIDELGASRIADEVLAMPIEKLQLSNCNISNAAFHELGRIFDSQTLKSVMIDSFSEVQKRTFDSITDSVTEAFEKILKNEKIESLFIEGSFRKFDEQSFLEKLKENHSIKFLAFNDAYSSSLYRHYNPFYYDLMDPKKGDFNVLYTYEYERLAIPKLQKTPHYFKISKIMSEACAKIFRREEFDDDLVKKLQDGQKSIEWLFAHGEQPKNCGEDFAFFSQFINNAEEITINGECAEPLD